MIPRFTIKIDFLSHFFSQALISRNIYILNYSKAINATKSLLREGKLERPVQSWGSLNIKLYTLGGERPTSLRPVGRRLSHVLLSYIMSTGRINRALPYTCLLSARGIISINESTSTRPGIISFADRRALGSYGPR